VDWTIRIQFVVQIHPEYFRALGTGLFPLEAAKLPSSHEIWNFITRGALSTREFMP
jgi:hypothetical protein